MGKGPQSRRLSVCLLANHPLVLTEFQAALARSRFVIEIRQVGPGLVAEPQSLKLPHAQVYVVDSQAPQATQRLVRLILNKQTGSQVLVLAEKFTDTSAFPLLRMGVRGLLSYAETRAQLQRAIQAVAAGSFWVPRILLARFVDSILSAGPARLATEPADLSRREREVMDGLLENLSNKEIASKLNISERTVKFHVSRILSKFHVQRRADLILRFYQERALYS